MPHRAGLRIDATKYSPSINLDDSSGLVTIKGESAMPDARSFYLALVNYLKYREEHIEPLKVLFELDYFNTSSSRIFIEIGFLFDNYYVAGGEVSMTWYAVDADSANEINDLFEGMTFPYEIHIKGVTRWI